ncbi:Flavoprotein [Ancylostoma caninum]|uniref:Flavoprotein n=1 Tax=Ancylostoma caninum TaxID=29170 RepID=A0A368GDF5_ANCCA|nr:Flavoprotein [Ancylostoma caninum]
MSSEANPASEEGSQSNGGVTEPNAKRIRQEDQSDDEEQSSSAKNIGRRPPFTRSHKIQRSGGKFHLLIGVSGSVAVIKLEELIQKLYQSCPENKLIIKVAATKAALNLLETQDFEIDEVIYEDRDEWSMWRGRGDQVLHIELRKWADAMLIAPLDANTLAKIAVGINDNLVTSIVGFSSESKLTVIKAPISREKGDF